MYYLFYFCSTHPDDLCYYFNKSNEVYTFFRINIHVYRTDQFHNIGNDILAVGQLIQTVWP